MSDDGNTWHYARQALEYFSPNNVQRLRAIEQCIFCETPTKERLDTQKRGDRMNVQHIPCCQSCTIKAYQQIAKTHRDEHNRRLRTHQALVTKARKILKAKETTE